MRVPGSNLLNMATRVIAKQTVSYKAFVSRSTNENGTDIAVYATAVDITGSLQPVPRNRYADMGLDFNKDYFNFFCSEQLLDLQRDVTGDIFTFAGFTYKVESLTPWFNIDGWVQALAVRTTSGDA